VIAARVSIALLLTCAAAIAQQPRIDSVAPSQGPISGGTIVTIRGANFTGASVSLDRTPVAPLSQSDSAITLQMPAHDNGYAILAVTRNGESLFSRFLAVPPPLAELPGGFITTVAGIGQYGGEYGPATDASLRQAWGIAFDASGVTYLTDTPNNRVLRIRADGILEPFAGKGLDNGVHPATPAPALDVTIAFPRSIAFDSHGSLIVPDGDYYLWRVDAHGIAEIIAGTGIEAHDVTEGVAAKGSKIGYPSYVAIDVNDNVYFIDWTNARVRKIDASGSLTTIAGNGVYGFTGDGGPATAAQFNLRFNDLGGLAVDHRGNLYLLDWGNQRVRRINLSSGVIDTIVGPALNGHTLNDIRSIAVGPDDALYFANAAEIYKRATDSTIAQIATGKRGFSEDGVTLPGAAIGIVSGMAVDANGNLHFADGDANRVRRIDRSTNRLTTLAGSGPRILGEGGSAIAAALQTANLDLKFLPSGDLLIADNNRICSLGSDGKLARFAGSGTFGPLFDVPAPQASIGLQSLFIARDGSIDFAGGLGTFRIDANGVVRHTAGKIATCDFSGDGGNALDAGFCQTWDALRDAEGNLLIADTNNNRIRRVDANGIVTTIAGSGAVNGLERYGFGSTCGDGGAATSACINTPYGVTFDDAGNLYVCENEQRIRRIDRSGVISTFANVRCTKLAWAFGSLFAAGDDSVVRLSRSGAVTRLTAQSIGFSGDGGPATSAHIYAQKQSHGVAVDREGNLFFADGDNLRIRAIRYGAVLPPSNATLHATSNGSTITATVLDASGHAAEGVRVNFAAPASGASCTLSSPFAITDANGAASVSCTSNCVAGTYQVSAQAVTSASISNVSMTNGSGPCHRRAARH